MGLSTGKIKAVVEHEDHAASGTIDLGVNGKIIVFIWYAGRR